MIKVPVPVRNIRETVPAGLTALTAVCASLAALAAVCAALTAFAPVAIPVAAAPRTSPPARVAAVAAAVVPAVFSAWPVLRLF